jgi:hypothetical protein
MGTGPTWSAYLDAITPAEDDWLPTKALKSTVGALLRGGVSQKTFDARDHLKTVNAKVALVGSQQMKGSSSDKDTALMRLAGIGPAKYPAENHRIINEAIHDSGLSRARALITADWIGKYGSLANPSPNGTTFEQALQNTERIYERRLAEQRLPKPPPSRRTTTGPVTIDINGNIIK